MKDLKLNDGRMINIKAFEIEGDNFGWDIWYFDEYEKLYHNLLFENDLNEVKELNKLVTEFMSKIPYSERVKFSIRKEV